MKWFRHIWKDEKDIIKKVTTVTIQNHPLGRPRIRWRDAVEKDIRMVDVNSSVELVFNRERWKYLTVAGQVLQGPLS